MNPELKKFTLIIFLACRTLNVLGQADSSKISHWYITGPQAALSAGSFIVLNEAWYKDFDRSSFHFFDDLPEWNQVDKMGHSWSSYQLTRINYNFYKKTRLNQNQSLLASTLAAQAYMSVIEVLDGYSEAWGFSPYDVAANLSGSALFVIQQAVWDEQKITLSFSYFPEGKGSLNPELLGSGIGERLLKDYNSQTFWLNVNPSSFMQEKRIPRWLDISLGAGASGMSGGRSNHLVCTSGNCFLPERERQWYLSAGIRFSRIRTNSRILRTLFFIADAYHVPLPALTLTGNKPGFRLFVY